MIRPLAPLEDARPIPSLTHDIASLIDAFSDAFVAHPELSEGFRNLVRNAADGRYWTAHREALHQAATEYTQVAQTELQKAEEEAASRVSYAVAHLARTVAQAAGVSVDPPAAGSGEQSSRGKSAGVFPQGLLGSPHSIPLLVVVVAEVSVVAPVVVEARLLDIMDGCSVASRCSSPPDHRPLVHFPPPPMPLPPMGRDGPPGPPPHHVFPGHGFAPPPPPHDHGFAPPPPPPDHVYHPPPPPNWSWRVPPPPPPGTTLDPP